MAKNLGYIDYKDNKALEAILNKIGYSIEFGKTDEDGDEYKYFDAEAFWTEALDHDWNPEHTAEVRVSGLDYVIVENIDWED